MWRVPRKAPQHLKGFFEFARKAGREAAYKKGERIFLEGDVASGVYFIQEGTVKFSVLSPEGKEAVVAILSPGDLFGECFLTGHLLRLMTSTAISKVNLLRVPKKAFLLELHKNPLIADKFISYLVGRKIKIEENLIDQLFNSTEKRLARALLLLAHYGQTGSPEAVVPQVSQALLAEMIGTSRARVSVFLNKFRKLGFIHYNGGLQVHDSLLAVVLHD